MKASGILLILFIVAVLAVLLKVGQPMPMAERPAVVDERLTETAERLKGTVRSVAKESMRSLEKEQAQQTEFYDATITGADGKVWSVKMLTDGKVLEIAELKASKGRLRALHDALGNWFHLR
jgi:hypothetical protein